MRYPYEVNLVGDAVATLRALAPLLHRKADRSWQDDLIGKISEWWETMDAEAHVAADPVNPMRIFHEFSRQAPGDVIVAADSGSAANWYARHLRMRDDMRGSLSGTLATMGPAVPYAIGAKFAHPTRPAVAFEGDGAMQMNGLAELVTIARYWPDWSDPRLVVAVLHNNDLNQVTWELRAMGGTPEFVAVPGAARHLVRGVRLRDRPRRHDGALARPARAGLEGRPLRQQTHRSRHPLRPRRPAHPAPLDAGADDQRGQGADQGRPEQVGRDQGRSEDQGAAVASE